MEGKRGLQKNSKRLWMQEKLRGIESSATTVRSHYPIPLKFLKMTKPLGLLLRGVRHLATQNLVMKNLFSTQVVNEVQRRFAPIKKQLRDDVDEIVAAGLKGKKSLEVGHKIVAIETTLSPRIYLEILNQERDGITELGNKMGSEALRKRISDNPTYIRFTAHPTEGQNLRAIKEKDAIIKLQTALNPVTEGENVPAENLVKLGRIATEMGVQNNIVQNAKLQGIPSREEFLNLRGGVQKRIIKSFVENPIHHVVKMTVQDERDMMIYHMDRCKKEVATIAARHPDAVRVDDVKFSSWAFDMDGKPHIHPGNGAIFEHQSQQKFFDSLLKALEDFADKIALEGGDDSKFRSDVLDKIKAERELVAGRILVGSEAGQAEEKIGAILAEYASKQEKDSGKTFVEIQNYVRSSGCKTAQNGFTTREEIDKTNAALAEIIRIAAAKEGFAADEIGTIARSFSEFSPETKRQVMCLMESALLHPQHEHIISQFDCQLSSFKNTVRLFEIAKQLPQHHELIPHFKKYYAEKSKEAGFDLYQQFFSEGSVARARESLVQVSPLAEDENTIPLLINFTQEMLADAECVDYIKRSGGVVRQTRSNSDGSSSLGAHKVVLNYLEADIAIGKMVEAAGLKLAILQGIGANDLERMAPWRLELLQSEFTAQGSDAQNQTRERLTNMLVKERDTSQEDLLRLTEKYTPEAIEALINFYYRAHRASEHGVEIELEGKPVNSGDLTHRGPIPANVVKKLGKLSSRPDSRTGDVATGALKENSMDAWDPSIFNRNMRRIGAISLQRASGVSTFSMAPFFYAPESSQENFDPQLVADLAAIPLMRNNNISAIFALGVADLKSFALANGVDLEVPTATILGSAQDYEKFLKIGAQEGSQAAMKFAQKNNFDGAEGMRGHHMCYQIEGCKRVLRNAVTPLIAHSAPEIKNAVEFVFQRAESGAGEIKRYNQEVIEVCAILVKDPQLDLETKKTLACVAQQISNVCRPNNFYDTRAKLTAEAHDALASGDAQKFDECCEWLAIIMRSAGNPVSPGRKVEEMFPYFRDNSRRAVVEMGRLVEDEEVEDVRKVSSVVGR